MDELDPAAMTVTALSISVSFPSSSILTFTTYALLGNELTAAVVFTSMALFSILIGMCVRV